MKFQILVKRLKEHRRLVTGYTHEAICPVPAWLSHTPMISSFGNSEEEAKNKVVHYLQGQLDSLGGRWLEVDLAPSPDRQVFDV